MRALTPILAALALGACSRAAPNTPLAAAEAEDAACAVPVDLQPAPVEPAPPHEIVRDAETVSYMLALIWSPEWCRTHADTAEGRGQCRDNRFSFTVHGLWPNGTGKRHPRYCQPAGALEPATVRRHFCMTPSPQLLQHEWAAHGVCGWTNPDQYFRAADRLWRQLDAPDLRALPAGSGTAGDLREAFVAANPRLGRDSLYVKVGSGNRLEEVRVCYDLKFEPKACAGLGAPDHVRLTIEPIGR